MAPDPGPEAQKGEQEKMKEAGAGTGTDQSPEGRGAAILNQRLGDLNEKEARFKAEYSFNFLSKIAQIAPQIIADKFGKISDPVEFTEQVGEFQKTICEAFKMAQRRAPSIQIPKLQDKMFGPQTLAAYKFVVQRGLVPGGNVLKIPMPRQKEIREEGHEQDLVAEKPTDAAQDNRPMELLNINAACSMNGARFIKLAKQIQMPDGTGIPAGIELSIKPLDKNQTVVSLLHPEAHAAGPWTILPQQAQELFVTYDKKGEKVAEDVDFYGTLFVAALVPDRRGARVHIGVNVANPGEGASLQPVPLAEEQCQTVAVLGQMENPAGKGEKLYLIRTEEGLEGWASQKNLAPFTLIEKEQGESPQAAVARARQQASEKKTV